MTITTDPNDPRLDKYRKKGHDDESVEQQDTYLALPEEDRKKGFLRPCRTTYKHTTCGTVTTVNNSALAETLARDPWFYGGTYCCRCRMHRPMSEFVWEPDGESLDPALWPDEIIQAVVQLRKERP